MAEKIINYIKKHIAWVSCTAAVVLMAIIVLIFSSNGDDEQSRSHRNRESWGYGITEGIPEFEAEYESCDLKNEGYAAVYYTDISTEQVNGYISKLENELGVDFSDEKYPKTAVYGEKIIAIHYNVTEKKMSVTVAEKSNGETNTSENNTSEK